MRILAALLSLTLLAHAADTADWQNLHGLTAGARIEVIAKGGHSTSGNFSSVTDADITVQTKSQNVVMPRSDVARVKVPRRGHAKWWGLGIGATAGAIGGATIGERITNESSGDLNYRALTTAITAAAGALIGFLIGLGLDSRQTTVYRA